MVVDAAVIGFAGQRGVGHGDDRDGQAGTLRVGGQQHRPQRRLAEQPAPFVEPQQRLGCAVDAGHRIGVDEIRRDGRGAECGVHAVDLDGGVSRPQSAVGDESRQRAGPDGIAELRDLRPARVIRRPRGAPAPAAPTATSPGPGRCARRRYEIPCRARVSASPADGRPAANSRCTESSARIVSGGCQRNRVAHTPRAVAEHLQRLVVAGAPHLGGERRARRHQHAAAGVVFVEPVGGVVPVLRDRVEGARRGQPPGPGQRRGRGQRDQHDDADGDPLVAFGVGERVRPLRARRAARQRDAAQQMRQAQRQRQPQQRLELVHVAQRRAGRVEERLHLMGDRRSQPARVSGGQQDDADQQDRDQPPARRHRPHAPARPDRRPPPAWSPAPRPSRSPATRLPWRSVRRTASSVGAAQHLGQRHPLRGDAGRLDEVEERRADPAQQHQRDHPPQHRQHRARQPTTR